MKKLILLLLFIPLVSFGQVTELNDLLDITSPNQFKRICIENGYEKTNVDETYSIDYMLSPGYEGEETVSAKGLARYYIEDGEWRFSFNWTLIEFYDDLFEEVKENCDFIGILDNQIGTIIEEFAIYNCSPNGAIGFSESEGWWTVHFFLNLPPKL